jgi:FkbM family methyltransferase
MNILKRALRKITKLLQSNPDAFLRKSRGIIHIGANQGQEREQYDRIGLSVIWIEPIEEVYKSLLKNIAPFNRQRAFNLLITDVDDRDYDFHIANNEGASSSILEFKNHKDIWPDVLFTETIKLKSTSLPTFLQRENIDLSHYDTLILDTQGSELIILEGSRSVLPLFNFIKVEVPDFESYKGCCTLAQLQSFMNSIGFSEKHRHRMATNSMGQSYYDIVYQARTARESKHPAINI